MTNQIDTPSDVCATVEAPVYAFEAMGFVGSRAMMKRLEAKASPDLDALFTSVETFLTPLGVTGIDEMHLEEDDEQGSRDIKVFVVVRLKGVEGLEKGFRTLPDPLEIALDELAHVLCCINGDDVVGPENWEFSNDYDFA